MGLITGISGGDLSAFASLYDLYIIPLYSLTLHIMRDESAAQTILAEVFGSVREMAVAFDPDCGSPFYQMVMLTRRKILDHCVGNKDSSAGANGCKAPDAFSSSAMTETGWPLYSTGSSRPSVEDLQCFAGDMFFSALTLEMIAKRSGQLPELTKSELINGIRELRDCAAAISTPTT